MEFIRDPVPVPRSTLLVIQQLLFDANTVSCIDMKCKKSKLRREQVNGECSRHRLTRETLTQVQSLLDKPPGSV